MSVLEVPGATMDGGAVELFVTDLEKEERVFWVHDTVLEDVEYFKAEASFQKAASGGRAPGPPHRVSSVVLPSAGFDGLVALLRRLYARRRWPCRAWAAQGPTVAAQAADLADMWLLSDIASEARHAAIFQEAMGLPPSAGGARSLNATARLLGGEPMQIIATDGDEGSHRLWVHRGVLEGVPGFGAEGRREKGMTLFRLPEDCHDDGLTALVRRLYAGRRWPADTWNGQGDAAAAQGARLASAWGLEDIAEEARGASRLDMSLSHETNDTICRMVCSAMASASAARFDLIEDFLEQKTQRGQPAILGVLEALANPCMHRKESGELGSGDSRELVDVFGFRRVCQMVGRHIKVHTPSLLEAAFGVVGDLFVILGYRSQSENHTLECLETLVDVASECLENGDMSGAAYEELLVWLLANGSAVRDSVSAPRVADYLEVKTPWIQNSSFEDETYWFTPNRVWAMDAAQLHRAACILLPRLPELAEESASALASALRISGAEALPVATLGAMGCATTARGAGKWQHLEAMQQVFLDQLQLSGAAIAGLLVALSPNCTVKRRRLVSIPNFQLLCRLAGRMSVADGRLGRVTRLDEIVLAVDRLASKLDLESEDIGVLQGCVAQLLDVGMELVGRKEASSETLDRIAFSLHCVAAASPAFLAELGDRAQAAVARRAVCAENLRWFTVDRLSALRCPPVAIMERWLLPRLDEVDDGTARAVFAACARAEDAHPELCPGDQVWVREPFMSDSDSPVSLRVGQVGLIMELDEDGDALVDFDGEKYFHWVLGRNFEKLMVWRAAADVGAETGSEAPGADEEESSESSFEDALLDEAMRDSSSDDEGSYDGHSSDDSR